MMVPVIKRFSVAIVLHGCVWFGGGWCGVAVAGMPWWHVNTISAPAEYSLVAIAGSMLLEVKVIFGD